MGLKVSSNLTKKILTNKYLLNGLEKISDHGTTFSATTSLVLSLGVRPLAIYSTPNVEKENKQYAITNSIASGLTKFAIVEAFALPIEKAVKSINNNPTKYLKPSTISMLKGSTSELNQSTSYKLLTQIIKLGTGFISAVPKSMITIALIPILMDKMFSKKVSPQQKTNKTPSFQGRIHESLTKKVAKLINNKKFQNYVVKNTDKSNDIPKHITAATDILLTSAFVVQTNSSSKIDETRKKPLIYNNVIATAITLLGGYGIDKLIQKNTKNFIEKFKQLNSANPKLTKYIEGINILRPAIIFAFIYYGVLPIISTYLSERVAKFTDKNFKD